MNYITPQTEMPTMTIEPPRCVACTIYIFPTRLAAVAARVPYYPHINQAVGRRCPGCAGETQNRLDLENHLLNLVEQNVAPPGRSSPAKENVSRPAAKRGRPRKSKEIIQ